MRAAGRQTYTALGLQVSRWTVFLVAGALISCVLLLAPSTAHSQRRSCTECHEDFKERLKKKNVHKPVKDSCEACHKRHGFQQQLILVKGMPGLCVDCHEDVQQEIEGENVHGALKEGGCTVCHDPHASDRDALMRETEEGTTACLLCHERLSAAAASEDSHPPFARGDCASCHEPHSSGNPYLLVDSESTVCGSCHKGVKAKHDVMGLEDFACSDCHDPHVSSGKSPLSPVAHPPFAEGDCSTCHTVEGDEIALAEGFPRADLCEDCHDDVAGLLGGSESHFGTSDMRREGASVCLECHDPHRSRWPSLVAGPQNDLCRKCHENLTSEGSHAGSYHRPFIAGDCTSCHDPHGGGGQHHFASDPAVMCTSCHEDLVAPPANGGVKHEAMAMNECLDCHSGHDSERPWLLGQEGVEICMECHDREQHEETHQPFMTGACEACHRNHSARPGLLSAPVNEMCLNCHREIVPSLAAQFSHPPVRDDDCLSCHMAHGSEVEGLLAEPQQDLCAACHDVEELVVVDGPKTAGGSEPVSGRVTLHSALTEGDCGECHNPHGSPIQSLLTRDKEQLCYSCHTEERVAFSEGLVHRPVAEGRCDHCHTPHGSVNSDLTLRAEPGLCTGCHDFSKPPLDQSHWGYDLSVSKCTTCHAPHASSEENLLNPFVHDPFAEGDCESCHEGVESGSDTSAFVAAVAADACLMCHDDKGEQAGHHTVDGIECMDCHEPHSAAFEPLLEDPQRLCRGCHQDILEAEGEGVIQLHRPIEDGSCLDCHQMHGPTAEPNLANNQLALCSDCHQSIRESTEHLTKHDPFRKGNCSRCHETHASTEEHLLIKEERILCKSCHGLTTDKMSAAHPTVPLSGENCTSCHDPHSTARGASSLVHPVRHPPYDDRECDVCHEPSGRVTGGVAVCEDCHDNEYDFSRVHNAGRSIDERGDMVVCLDCHSPHAGQESLLNRRSQPETCLQCHDRKDFTRRTVHAALEDGCTTCHDLHTNNIEDLRSIQVNQLCIDCHEESMDHMHPLGSSFKDPRTGMALTCVSCHEPHSSDFEYMLTFDRRRDLCIQCHAAGTMKVH